MNRLAVCFLHNNGEPSGVAFITGEMSAAKYVKYLLVCEGYQVGIFEYPHLRCKTSQQRGVESRSSHRLLLHTHSSTPLILP